MEILQFLLGIAGIFAFGALIVTLLDKDTSESGRVIALLAVFVVLAFLI